MEKEIEKIKNYFMSATLQKNNDDSIIVCLETVFPTQWEIESEHNMENGGVNIIKGMDYPGQYIFISKINYGISNLFNKVNEKITEVKTREEKQRLMDEKRKELEALFQSPNISIDSLRNIRFDYPTTNIEEKTEDTEILYPMPDIIRNDNVGIDSSERIDDTFRGNTETEKTQTKPTEKIPKTKKPTTKAKNWEENII